MPTIVSTTGLHFAYGDIVALSGVDLDVPEGRIGLVGANGAGKTTLLKLLLGILTPADGTIRVLGSDPLRTPSVYRDLVLVPEEDAVYGFLTGRQYVEYAAVLAGAPKSKAAEAIATVALEDAQHRPITGYSKGMRQRAKVAAALAHDPLVLFLDEPLNGTDPVQRAHLIDLFSTLAERGHTVIVSSHVLHEVERMADRVIAMVDGRLAAAGSVADLRTAMTDIPRRIRIDTSAPRKLGAALLIQDWVESVRLIDDTVHVEVRDPKALGHRLPALCRDLGARLTRVDPEDESLESVFRYLVSPR